MSFSRFLFLSILTAAIVSGCASFPGRELPIYAYEQIPAMEKKIYASFDVKAFGPRGENKKFEQRLEKEIQKILTQSLAFAQLEPNKNDGEYHYSFVYRDEGNEALAFLSGFISGFTLAVVPAYARDNYILSIDVKQGDKLIKTYTYRDHMNSWIEALLLVVTPIYWPPAVAQSIFDNMLMNFVHDYFDDIKSGVYLAQTQ